MCALLDTLTWAITLKGSGEAFWEYDTLVDAYTNTPDKGPCQEKTVQDVLKAFEEIS